MTRANLWMVGILVLAAGVRLATHVELRDYVLYQVPLVDAEDYVGWAERVASGQPEIADVYYKAPLYPWVLSIAMRVFGPGAAAAYLLNAVLGLVSVVLMGLWGRRLLGAKLGVAAACLFALYGPILYFEAQALPPPLIVALSLGVLLLLTSGRERPGRGALLGAGVLLGLLVLTRPSFVLWLPVCAAWVAWRRPRRDWRAALLVLGAAAVVVVPVTLRNHARGGTWVLVSANGGINFYLGNNADAARTSAMRPGLEWEELVRRIPEEHRQGRARWDRWFARQAWTWVRSQPMRFVGGLTTKTLQYWNAREIDRNLDARGFRARSFTLRALPRYAWLAPWVVLGIVVAWRRGAVGKLAVFVTAASCAATILFFVSERYRLDAIAMIIPFALAGLAQVIASVRRQPGSMRAGWVVLLVGAGVLLAAPNWIGIQGLQTARATALEGVAYYSLGRNVEAIELLQRATAEEPRDADAHYQLGTALRRANRYEEALVSFDHAARIVPGNPKPHAGAGLVLRQLGRPQEALERYRKALRQEPTNVLLLFETGEVLEGLGRSSEAQVQYRAVVERATDAGLVAEAQRRLERLR